MKLLEAVQLYRLSGKPQLSKSNEFIGEFFASEETVTALKKLTESNVYGSLKTLEIDSTLCRPNQISGALDNLQVHQKIKVVIRCPKGEAIRFFKDFDDLLSLPMVSTGELPEAFYIINKDIFYPSDSPDSITSLKNLTELITSLKSLAHYHDSKVGHDRLKLVFIANNDGKNKPVVLDIRLNESLLTNELNNLSIVKNLTDGSGINDIHHQAKLGIFVSSICEFINGLEPTLAFSKIASEWTDFSELFQNNLSVYLCGFAFNQAKKDIAETEIKIAEQLSKITSDLTGKLFSIPLSFTALIAMFNKDTTWITNLILCIGLLITSIIIVGVIVNQSGQLTSVIKSKELFDKALEGEKNLYPKELDDYIKDMNLRLDNNIKLAKNWLVIFRVLAWFPILIATVIYYLIY
ncbi:hypothetical protein [Photobacterium phosphoreum]|jgi:hypothetical protein|uniref:hypothetical protein n=2 Tax=Photobacterium phosphoreum TaxID=659 RepID=UPI0007F8C204|nr:hypothetical protein [Photobacterium phosphoreum]OBU37939.1 hypothetical protein AYY24_01440 [Photobacterium phosphoreum]PSW38915.1 hypothetical protein CTM87_01090 [Photobacterium phosphoreum]